MIVRSVVVAPEDGSVEDWLTFTITRCAGFAGAFPVIAETAEPRKLVAGTLCAIVARTAVFLAREAYEELVGERIPVVRSEVLIHIPATTAVISEAVP